MPQKQEKIPLSQVRKFPYKTLNRMISKAKKFLKNDETMKKIFAEYDETTDIIDFIPTCFGNLNVSAKTNKGIVILNYKLLCDGDFLKDYSYLIHEYTHWADQCLGDKPTQGSDDGDYLDNVYEQEAFQNQVEYISDKEGEEEAEQYVDDLLEHHEVEDPKEKEEKKDIFLANV